MAKANELAVLDLRTGALKTSLALGELPWRAYSTADGRFMLVPNNGDGTISVDLDRDARGGRDACPAPRT